MARRHRLSAVLALLVAAAFLLAACGDDDEDSAAAPRGTAADRAFLTGMSHHHQSGIDMADVALEVSRDRTIRRLAADIDSAQKREIAQMRSIYRRLFGDRLVPDENAHDALGLSAEEAGMTHSPAAADELRTARPFDRAFVDAMVPHHSGALRMSEVILKRTKDAEVRKLAHAIIDTQRREILTMNSFRTKRYGAPAPEGAGHGGAAGPGRMQNGDRDHHPG